MVALPFAEQLGVLGFILATANTLGGLYAWFRLQRPRFKVTLVAGEDGPPEHRQFGIFIKAVNLRSEDSVEEVWIQWEANGKQWLTVPRELWKTDSRVPPRAAFRATLRGNHLKNNKLVLPSRATAKIRTDADKSFKSRAVTLHY